MSQPNTTTTQSHPVHYEGASDPAGDQRHGGSAAEVKTRMARAALRVLGSLKITVAAASAAAVLAVATTAMSPAVQLTATPALILGGTGTPTPGQDYLDAAISKYIAPALGGSYDPVAVYTPEEGLGTLPGETMSIEQSTIAGLPYLDAAIAKYPNQPIVVFGYSQSGAIASLEKKNLAAYAEAHPDAPVPDVTFVWAACGCRPNGSLSYRTGGKDTTLFDGRARTDTPFKTVDIAWQYDISSDTPLYPINLLADINWLLGGLYVHTNYLPLPAGSATYPDGGQVPTLDGLQGVTAPGIDTTYYFIPSEHLPLFGPLRSLGVPESLISIIEPLARVMVEWGYDRTIAPWEPTPFQLIPAINPVTAATDVVNAIGQGFVNAFKAIGITVAPNTAAVAPTVTGVSTTSEAASTAPLTAAVTADARLVSAPSEVTHTGLQPTGSAPVSTADSTPTGETTSTTSPGSSTVAPSTTSAADTEPPTQTPAQTSTATPPDATATGPEVQYTSATTSTAAAPDATSAPSGTTAGSGFDGGTASSPSPASAKKSKHSPSATAPRSTASQTTGTATPKAPDAATASPAHHDSSEPKHDDEAKDSAGSPKTGANA